MEKKAYVERIMAFITNQQTGRKEEGDEPAPVPPEPESWTIDGVTYYNRHVFDLEQLVTLTRFTRFDILTGNEISQEEANIVSHLYLGCPGPNPQTDPVVVQLSIIPAETVYIYANGNPYVSKVMTSTSFEVFNTKSEIKSPNRDKKICLPTCSAYYGFLSEDGKTFISYFNLKD